MKYKYIAVQVTENSLNYAYVIKVSTSDNLLSKLAIKNIISANICDTKKQAAELVNHWNECFKRNNTYMFSDPSF